MSSSAASNRRCFERRDLQVQVQFNFHGHEKVFESHTQNISLAGMFIEASEEILKLMDIGASVVLMLEFKTDFFIRLTGYIVRIQATQKSCGFAIRFLNLSEEQVETISSLISKV